jgi:hypothetical protein
MIHHSPETNMSEPYRTYIDQRAEAIASVLNDIVDNVGVQLCPRAIAPDEVVLHGENPIIYGCVVREPRHGEKSILYDRDLRLGQLGIATDQPDEVEAYTRHQLSMGNRVRVKDPGESDGQGQLTVESEDEALEALSAHDNKELVFMPHLAEVSDRYSVGIINLGHIGAFGYFGRELMTQRNGTDAYGGSDIGVARLEDIESMNKIAEILEVSSLARKRAELALRQYQKLIEHVGRVSIDVINGLTDSGLSVVDPVDITPRVGGTTPAEVLAIRELIQNNSNIAYADSRLTYNPNGHAASGIRFVDTPTLRITANIKEVI